MKVVSKYIADSAIIESKIANGAVTEDKIGTGAVTSDKIGTGAVTEGKIASSAVTATKIGSGAVTEEKIADSAVTVNKLATDSVTAAKIATGAVTADKLATGSVVEAKIASSAVTADKIGTSAVTADKIGTGAVTESKIGAGAVTATKLATDSVTETKIADGAVTVNKIGTGAVVEGKIADNAVTATKLADGAVVAAKIGADAVDGSKIADGAINSEHIATGAIDGEHLSDDAKESVLQYKLVASMIQIDSYTASSSTEDDIIGDIYDGPSSILINYGKDASDTEKGILQGVACNLRDSTTKNVIEDANSVDVYGKLEYDEASGQVTSTAAFTNGSDQITFATSGDGSTYTVGDIVRCPEDGFYKIIATAAGYIQIDRNYEGTTASSETEVNIANLNLKYYKMVSGVETAHTMSGQTIDIQYPVVLDLNEIPYNAIITGGTSWIDIGSSSVAAHNHDDRYYTETELGTTSGTTGASLIGVDPTSIVGSSSTNVQDVLEDIAIYPRYEKLTIATQNVVPNLGFTPKEATAVVLVTGGFAQPYGASNSYSVSGKAVTWYSANAGFDLDPGDEVWAIYDSTD